MTLSDISSYQSNFEPLVAPEGLKNAVGNTPLIKLNHISRETKRNIWVKSEWQNPGGSIKDRTALYLIEGAERKGLLKPGGTIVEGTSGNTGIGLAHIAKAKGYKCVAYMPDIIAKDKVQTLELLGVEVHLVPVVPITDPDNFEHQAKRYAESLPNGYCTNQIDNLDNRQAHIETTGPEIYKQLKGSVDAFICTTGTGGTWAGITHYLKSKSPAVKSFIADPPGSAVYEYIKTGTTHVPDPSEKTFAEGIGPPFITRNLESEAKLADGAFFIPDEETIVMLYRLIDEEGLYVGGSSALNVVAAVKAANEVPEGSNVVTVLPDSASKYARTIFSKEWLKSKNLYDVIPIHLRKYASLN